MIYETRCTAHWGTLQARCQNPGKVTHRGRWYCGVHDPERRSPVYRDDGQTYFCRTCQVSFVKDAAAISDHERRNRSRHWLKP